MEEATAREDLAWIRSLMADSQTLICGTWRYQLVWGILAIAALVGTWMALRVGTYSLILWVWAVAMTVGWAYSLRQTSMDPASMPVRNVASRSIGGIWIALGITLTLFGGTSLLTGAIDPRALSGIIAIVFGAGYFASGFISGMTWLTGVGAAWWGGGLILLVWSPPDNLLLLAGMTLALAVAPALRLRQIERDSTQPA